jgi:hypothetical protein
MKAGCRLPRKAGSGPDLTGISVATMAVDSQYENPYEDEAPRLPVSLHPAFPAIVALWFAALLGIGSLMLPAVLLDRVVSATGLASLLPAAAPPLGTTARAIVAILGALAGAALGVAVAWRVAGTHAPKAESRAAKLAAGSLRPISVHDELGGAIELGAVTNGEGLPISHRRALAISEDDCPSDFLYRAPLPGQDPDAPAPFAAAPIVSARLDDDPGPDEEPLELSEFAHEDDENDADGDSDTTEASDTPSAWPSHRHYPGGPAPLPFAAPSLARGDPELGAETEAEPEPELQLEAVAADESPEPHADWQTAPLDGLGLVQLVQRLGATIERRRELMARAAAQPPAASPAPPPAFAEPDLEPAAPEDAVQAMAAFFGTVPAEEPEPEAAAEPAAATRLEPFGSLPLSDEKDSDEAIPDFSLPLRPTSAPADNDAADVESAESEVGFTSRLAMTNPFATAPGSRLFDAPGETGTPPAAAPQVPADAEAALRAALMTLRRMSGAA